MKYRIGLRPKGSDELDVDVQASEHIRLHTRDVFELEDEPEDTGLLDQNGYPLLRIRERGRIGFIHFDD
jgi:hypothetical protein